MQIMQLALRYIYLYLSSVMKIFQTIRQALRGDFHNYTQGSIPKAVFLLAIPMILELSLESVFVIVDMFFVSKLGSNAIATVGLTESVITLVYSLGVGLSTAAMAIVARRIGEKDHDAAARAGAQSMLVAFCITVVISILGVIFAPDILRGMGASEAVISEGTSFARIMFGSSTAIIFLFLINGIFRGAGDATMAMKSLWVASAINIILCPIFIHFFGLKGAAIATLTGRSTGVFYQCYHLFNGKRVLKFLPKYFNWNSELIKSILKIAWSSTFQFLIASGSWIVLTRLVAETGGTDASAGYQIAFRNFIFFILPAWGLSNAAATMVGQNLGAKQCERAEQSVILAAKFNALFTTFVTILLVFFGESIVRIFTQDEAVVAYGAMALKIIGSGYVFYGIGMVLIQALNGAGDTKTPSIINILAFWAFQIPFAYVMANVVGLKSTGVFMSIPAAQILIVIMSYYYFKKGKWKQMKV